jgi:hypothetical protein
MTRICTDYRTHSLSRYTVGIVLPSYKFHFLYIEAWGYHAAIFEKLVLVILLPSLITLILKKRQGISLLVGK